MEVNIFEDNYMKYDFVLHQYYLTPEATLEYVNVDLNAIYGSNGAIVELKKHSSQVYSWLYSKVMPSSKMHVEFLIATGGMYRDAMFKALLAQAEYAATSGGNEVQLQHGVQLSKGLVTSIEVLRGNLQVALGVEQALSSVGLLFNGFYNWRLINPRVGY